MNKVEKHLNMIDKQYQLQASVCVHACTLFHTLVHTHAKTGGYSYVYYWERKMKVETQCSYTKLRVGRKFLHFGEVVKRTVIKSFFNSLMSFSTNFKQLLTAL